MYTYKSVAHRTDHTEYWLLSLARVIFLGLVLLNLDVAYADMLAVRQIWQVVGNAVDVPLRRKEAGKQNPRKHVACAACRGRDVKLKVRPVPLPSKRRGLTG